MNLNPNKVLLVEDNMITSIYESSILIKAGFQVTSVSSGEAAIDFLNHGHNFDIILMDVDLEDGMSGIEAASLINEKFNVPLIFYTGHDELDLFLSVTDIEKFGYIPKNSEKKDVIQIIRNCLFLTNRQGHTSENIFPEISGESSDLSFNQDATSCNV